MVLGNEKCRALVSDRSTSLRDHRKSAFNESLRSPRTHRGLNSVTMIASHTIERLFAPLGVSRAFLGSLSLWPACVRACEKKRIDQRDFARGKQSGAQIYSITPACRRFEISYAGIWERERECWRRQREKLGRGIRYTETSFNNRLHFCYRRRERF